MPTKFLPRSAGALPPKTTPAPAQLRRERGNGLNLVAVETPVLSEFHLTATPGPGEPLSPTVHRVAELLRVWEASAVRVIVFGPVKEQAATLASLRQALHEPALPVTWVEGAACDGSPIAGMQLHAVSGATVKNLCAGERVVGRTWSDGVANHCVLGALEPDRQDAPRPQQARETFENLRAALALAGMTVNHVTRTWLFLDDILSWYGDFNAVRTSFFAQTELRPGSFPASTGVSGRNPSGTALTAAAWAVQPLAAGFQPFTLAPSPRQCPAPAYGSSFSRAAEIHSAGFRQLLISGTASIAPEGQTAHVGDVRGQIELTMQVVEAILESRRMSLADVSRATAYFKSAADLPVFQDWLARRELRTLPVVNAVCEICRDDLLFEIEVDAIQAGN